MAGDVTRGAIDYRGLEAGRHVNYWSLDRTFQRELRRVTSAEAFGWAAPRLDEFGTVVGHTIADNADYIDDHGPELETYDAHGNVQNYVRYPAEQRENEVLTYGAGAVADVFRAPAGREDPLPMTHYLAMLYLLGYAESGGFACPVAMTAGAALVLERYGDDAVEPYLAGLLARDYDDLIEGAMFLTEEQGGSDVGAIETVAERDEEAGWWRLTGEKWFCSNIDAEGTLALARTPDAPEGTAGLSMFLVPHADPTEGVMTKGRRDEFDGPPPGSALNAQRYRRLKDKLGTVSVPTGEVEFHGAKAFLVGEREAGFAQMAEMLNLERLSNAAVACALMGRALLEAKVHAANREAFGRRLDRLPLMRADLVDMAVDHEAATAFTFEAGRLFAERERARRDGNDRSEAFRLMRLLIPIAKLRTARMAVDTASYAMEVLGGNGYVNDFVTNRLLRDAQVLPIWEGTENVLALDVVRALDREAAHEPFTSAVSSRLAGVTHPALAEAKGAVEAEIESLTGAMAALADADDDVVQLAAKRLAHYAFDVFAGALLLAEGQADLTGSGPTGVADGRTALVARRFVTRHLADRSARGIPDDDRLPLDRFDALVRFAPVDPASLTDETRA